MSAQDVTVRLATRDDMPDVMQMIKDLATYEKVPDGPKISAEDLIRDGFDSSPPWLFALVAELRAPERRLVGYSLCHRAYSSWLGRAMYLEDFYVEPQMRGMRVGLRLFRELCKDVTVRLATRDDMPDVMQMIKDLATYEKVPDGPKISAEDLIRDGFDSSPPWLFALVAELRAPERRLVGYSLCHRAYSSWLGRAMYLEDFYVEPQMRGMRVGLRLFRELCKMACAENVQQLDWHVLVDNRLAIEFYERQGAYDLCGAEGRTAYRMKRERIRAVADAVE